MRIKEGFMLREVAGTYAVIPLGKASVDFNGMITLNEVGAFLWKCLEKGATQEELVQEIVKVYEIDEKKAMMDIEIFLNKIKEENLSKNKIEVQLSDLMPIILEKIEIGADVTLVASGNSMYPLFRNHQDTFNLKKIENDPQKYDMVLYQRNNGKYVLHRIVGKVENEYILRGDNQFVNEYGIRKEQIIAKVNCFYRKGKRTDCNQFSYRFYSFCWVNSIGVRKIIYRIKNKFK